MSVIQMLDNMNAKCQQRHLLEKYSIWQLLVSWTIDLKRCFRNDVIYLTNLKFQWIGGIFLNLENLRDPNKRNNEEKALIMQVQMQNYLV